MSFNAAAFQLTDAQLARLPREIIGKATSAFSRNHSGKFGFGECYRFTTSGTDRFRDARERWVQLTGSSPALPHGLTASAPVCFAACTFDARPAARWVLSVSTYVLYISSESHWLRYICRVGETMPSQEVLFADFLAELPDEPDSRADAEVPTVSAH